jgi:hypothetical protein
VPAACHLRNCAGFRKRLAVSFVRWVHSYVTGDKIYCVYIAPSAETIREHATRGRFPANRISEIESIIDPTTAEG